MIRQASAVIAAGILLLTVVLAMYVSSEGETNLIDDPSFELPKPKDQFGRVFAKWEGWKYEGDCRFEVGTIAHSGKTSSALSCAGVGKIRIVQLHDLTPGRYRITAYLRGLDVGVGQWSQTTEFMFNDKYMNLSRKGNFGWTKLTYVAELAAAAKAGPSFGLLAPGMLWIDDVSMERVGKDAVLTPEPVLAQAESGVEPPGALGAGSPRCPRCSRRNLPGSRQCYACGAGLEEGPHVTASGPAVKTIASFEAANPFDGGAVVAAHATDGQKALEIRKASPAVMEGRQDWSGYDFLKADTYNESEQPLSLTIEIRDAQTDGYWTRVNYYTVVPPGPSTLALPIRQLYVGEKSRPGRRLMLNDIRRLVFVLAESAAAPMFLDNVRLEREPPLGDIFFEGLQAFDFGPAGSPVMDGFTPVTPTTLYDAGRGYGLKDAKVWRTFDVLQPDPLYQDFIAIEAGGLAVDVPNGRYRVFVNMDSAGGYWGEVQSYRQRSIAAQGKTVVAETMNLKSFTKKYFNFWDVEDLPTDNTFDKYGRAHFLEKTFEVNVTNGQLSLEFKGQNWACSVSAVILFPVEKAAQGERFLEWARNRRRFYFDNAFKRVLHRSNGDPLQPTAEDTARGYVRFARDPMRDLYYNDTPLREEVGQSLAGDGFAGESEPVTLGVIPLRDLGKGTVTASALAGPQGSIPASAIEVGYVSYRLARLTGDGTVYTITPRLVMPRNSVELPKGIARQYWLTVHVPAETAPGVYIGQATFAPEKGPATVAPLRFTVRKGRLAATDIPVGPFGGPMGVPWPDDPESGKLAGALTEKSLQTLRAWGFTMFSGVPYVRYLGFRGGKPELDFEAADRQMRTVREMGFLAVSSYGDAGLIGLRAYQQDTDKMKAAGFSDYAAFLKAIFTEIEAHAREKKWPTVYWNIGDEPVGADALKQAVQNAAAYRGAFPKGPPFFTAATSLYATDPDGLHLKLATALTVPALNLHDEGAVKRLLAAGGQWAYYNNGSRWTFGEYLYKAAKEFNAQYRLAWHWNNVAGDPYYALDCREDDYAWANATPDGRLTLSLEFQRIAAGLTDYRYLLTLARMAKERAGSPAAQAAERLIAKRMAAFRLGDVNRSLGPKDWRTFREQVGAAIEALAH